MSYDIFQRLGTRSVDIEKVLSVIRDVTEQTNLLSLNAAILAAQAGEYGKSFSVVADEIRALSERTSASTLEIGGIVKTIRKDIRDAIGSIDTTRIKVDDGNGLVVKVGEVLREILHASVKSSDMTKAIEHATGAQAIGLRQVKEAIENIRKMMNSVAKSTKEQEGALVAGGEGDVGLHVFFLLKSLAHLAPGGRLAFLLPADVCEGISAASVFWNRICQQFRLGAAMNFADEAAPFPTVDTNAMVFLFTKEKPLEEFLWLHVRERDSEAIAAALDTLKPCNAVQIHHRKLAEALKTGLSRPPGAPNNFGTPLSYFAKVVRGICDRRK